MHNMYCVTLMRSPHHQCVFWENIYRTAPYKETTKILPTISMPCNIKYRHIIHTRRM